MGSKTHLSSNGALIGKGDPVGTQNESTAFKNYSQVNTKVGFGRLYNEIVDIDFSAKKGGLANTISASQDLVKVAVKEAIAGANLKKMNLEAYKKRTLVR